MQRFKLVTTRNQCKICQFTNWISGKKFYEIIPLRDFKVACCLDGGDSLIDSLKKPIK